MLRAATYTPADIGGLMDICAVTTKATVSLMLFGLKSHLNPTQTPQQMLPEVVALANRNTIAFQEVLQQLQPFQLRCLAKEVEPLTAFVASLKPADLTDIRKQGLAQVRSGTMEVYTGGLLAANDTRLGAQYRASMLATLAETSGRFATILELPVRRQLRDSVRTAASQAPDAYKGYLVRIADSLSSETCDGLCAIH
jgi:hypothetical protein